MHMRRFTRLTNAFSKKLENHIAAISLHFMYYNFSRIHQKLSVTPAMALVLRIARETRKISSSCLWITRRRRMPLRANSSMFGRVQPYRSLNAFTKFTDAKCEARKAMPRVHALRQR